MFWCNINIAIEKNTHNIPVLEPDLNLTGWHSRDFSRKVLSMSSIRMCSLLVLIQKESRLIMAQSVTHVSIWLGWSERNGENVERMKMKREGSPKSLLLSLLRWRWFRGIFKVFGPKLTIIIHGFKVIPTSSFFEFWGPRCGSRRARMCRFGFLRMRTVFMFKSWCELWVFKASILKILQFQSGQAVKKITVRCRTYIGPALSSTITIPVIDITTITGSISDSNWIECHCEERDIVKVEGFDIMEHWENLSEGGILIDSILQVKDPEMVKYTQVLIQYTREWCNRNP